MKIVVGVDGSPSAYRAIAWCAAHAPALCAEIVVVHAVELPLFAASGFGVVPLPIPSEPDHEAIGEVMARDWCAALTEAGVKFRTVVTDGSPAGSIIELAKHEQADLVVTGRRGLGGFAELLLGSTSHELAHHLNRPLVIVP